MLKRLLDIILSVFLVLLCGPLALLIALIVKLESPGPVIHPSPRVGRHGRRFDYYRFRTMTGSPLVRTRFGRLIGNLSLDELPALWNILKGDLSLVGPRPELPEKVDLADPAWQRILSVRPGITGLGLLTYLESYNQTPPAERLRPELDYVERQSLAFDLWLLARSFYLWLRMGHLKGKF